MRVNDMHPLSNLECGGSPNQTWANQKLCFKGWFKTSVDGWISNARGVGEINRPQSFLQYLQYLQILAKRPNGL